MTINTPTPNHIPELRRLWQQAFGDTDAFLDSFFTVAFAPERCRCLYEDGQLAAALYWFDCSYDGQKAAYLYAVATEEAYQSRGLCRALMENTHRHLASLGYDSAILVPGNKELFALYEKLGYRTATTVGEFTCSAGAAPAAVRRIDAAEYAILRRQLLPPGGVVQEGAALALLEAQDALYAVENSPLVAAQNGEELVCSELLGPVEAAPSILAAFGAAYGRFRIPNGSIPFAMHLPLRPNSIPPAYFGLALD